MKTTSSATPTLTEDPRNLSATHLEKLGVSRLNKYNLVLRCNRCGQVWSPRLNADSTLPPGYWQCPNRCNV
jgi:hypothetical protein